MVPAIKQKRIEGKNEQTDSSVMLEAVPFCPYTQTIRAKLVIAVPKVDTDCEPHRIRKSLRPQNILCFLMALLLHIYNQIENAKPDTDGRFMLPLHAIPVKYQTLHGASAMVRIMKHL